MVFHLVLSTAVDIKPFNRLKIKINVDEFPKKRMVAIITCKLNRSIFNTNRMISVAVGEEHPLSAGIQTTPRRSPSPKVWLCGLYVS